MATKDGKTPSAAGAAVKPPQPKPERAVEGLEEDDEFEEFEEDGAFAALAPPLETGTGTDARARLDWDVKPEEREEQEWKDDWDDEMMDGDFVTQLRQELAKSEAAASASAASGVAGQREKAARTS